MSEGLFHVLFFRTFFEVRTHLPRIDVFDRNDEIRGEEFRSVDK